MHGNHTTSRSGRWAKLMWRISSDPLICCRLYWSLSWTAGGFPGGCWRSLEVIMEVAEVHGGC